MPYKAKRLVIGSSLIDTEPTVDRLLCRNTPVCTGVYFRYREYKREVIIKEWGDTRGEICVLGEHSFILSIGPRDLTRGHLYFITAILNECAPVSLLYSVD